MTNGPRRSNHPPKPEQASTWVSADDGAPRVSMAWITRPRVGEVVSGDAVIVSQHNKSVMISVIDALGHGPKAADVAQTCTEWLGTTARGEMAAAGVVQGLHRALHGSRGAAALVLLLTTKGVEACSVGNVELRSSTGKLPFVLTPGVLGVRLRAPRSAFAAAPLSDRFVAYSDGISGRFDLKSMRAQSPAELAVYLFNTHRYDHDDASVVVIDVELTVSEARA